MLERDRLTTQERTIAALIRRGFTNAQIAEHLTSKVIGARNAPRYLLLTCLLAIGSLLLACGVSTAPTSSPTPASSVAPSATPSPGPTPPRPTATEGSSPALYPRGTRTGVPGVDAFVSAMESSDGAALLALLRHTPVPCSVAGYPAPVCPNGAADGTPVDTLPNGRCDGSWYMESLQIRRFVAGDFGTFAVARLPLPALPIAQGGYPPADYVVVMEDRRGLTGEPRAGFIAGDGVVALFIGCGWVSPGQFLESRLSGYSASKAVPPFLLPPK